MSRLTTEAALRDWIYGQIPAERLVAQLLHLEGYAAITPQHPLGGPDGKKDILFVRDNEQWLAAVFFPPTASSFSELAQKFKADLQGVARNSCAGIAFFTNEYLKISERAELIRQASPYGADIYERERICRILDSPRGCGLRLQYLHIAMTEEEQWSFWQVMNTNLGEQLSEAKVQLERIERKLHQVLVRTNNLLFDSVSGPSSMNEKPRNVIFATSALDTSLLCWIHRMATEDSGMPDEARGKIRTVDVWLSKLGSAYGSANWHPPEPESIEHALDRLFNWWTTKYPTLISATRPEVIVALTRLHYEILLLHPFLDGNGRVARLLIDQGAHELLGESVSKEMISDRSAYYSALQSADRGDIIPLEALVTAALS
jgi:fido (protein-threonine AMPylation protein)